jgi:hypothetical protein
MKKTIIALALLISTASYSQKISKEDSILNIEAQRYADTLFLKTTIRELSEWAYSNLTEKMSKESPFNTIVGIFLNSKATAWIQEKKKLKK